MSVRVRQFVHLLPFVVFFLLHGITGQRHRVWSGLLVLILAVGLWQGRDDYCFDRQPASFPREIHTILTEQFAETPVVLFWNPLQLLLEMNEPFSTKTALGDVPRFRWLSREWIRGDRLTAAEFAALLAERPCLVLAGPGEEPPAWPEGISRKKLVADGAFYLWSTSPLAYSLSVPSTSPCPQIPRSPAVFCRSNSVHRARCSGVLTPWNSSGSLAGRLATR
jgi:hypothetical protein